MSAHAACWDDTVLAATLFAVDPAGLAWQVRSPACPARDALLAQLRAALPPAAPVRRCPLGIGDDRLLGGLDLAATLARGRPVAQRGLLAESDGGVLVLPMAERVSRRTAARLCAVLDSGELLAERDGVALRDAARLGLVLLDEGLEDEAPAAALLERAAFHTDLDGLSALLADPGLAGRVAAARALLPRVRGDGRIIEALCETALRFGLHSLRLPTMALRVARIAAALDGRLAVVEQDAVLAARLVLAWRARALPQPSAGPAAAEQAASDPPEAEASSSRPGQQEPAAEPGSAAASRSEPEGDPQEAPGAMGERVLDAARAALPADLLARLQAQSGPLARPAGGGRVGSGQGSASPHGRPLFARAGRPQHGKRLALVETLRAAAPWQDVRRLARARRGAACRRVEVRADDFRVVQHQERPRNIAIFVVDASGSAAMNRLAEAKGAIERLLADCYVRRDRVALIAFRGRSAELLLPPTAALTRARRSLAGLPGGGGTPLAAGLDAAAALALALRARGETPLLVVLTDGRANVTRDGQPDRARAVEQAGSAAARLRLAGVASLLVDISPRTEAKAQALAGCLGARYLKLPDSEALSRAVRAAAA